MCGSFRVDDIKIIVGEEMYVDCNDLEQAMCVCKWNIGIYVL
jgi:hypothetical protein